MKRPNRGNCCNQVRQQLTFDVLPHYVICVTTLNGVVYREEANRYVDHPNKITGPNDHVLFGQQLGPNQHQGDDKHFIEEDHANNTGPNEERGAVVRVKLKPLDL